MKKVFSFFSMGCLIFMAACGGGNSNNNSEATEEDVTIADVIPTSTVNNSSDDVDESTVSEEASEESSWNPVGSYDFEDANGNKFTLVIKKGGNAVLTDHFYVENYKDEYTPEKGSWTRISGKDALDLDFFSGPFVKIGTHEYIQYPVLTPDYLYYDMDAFKNDGECVEVKKVS